ncbi:MAG: LysE family transporter [Chloroflexota bacterium]
MTDLLRNILLGISLAAPIGPSGLAVIQNGLRHGFLRAFVTGLGVTLADATYLLLVFFGLSRLIDIPLVKVLIWSLGALVLIYLGIQSIREAFRSVDLDKPIEPVARNPLLAGYLVNISNPIAIVWWLGVFGSLLGTTAGDTSRLGALLGGSSILVGILTWHTSISLLTHWGKRILNASLVSLISGLAGLALVVFGLRFAWLAVSTLIH